MSATPRVDVGSLIYHAWNRANAGGQLFVTDADYQAFEHIVTEAKILTGMGILAYCIMPNHWHFVLQPKNDGDLGTFFHWLTLTHAKRWHSVRGSVGQGHLYQGTFKSNLCQNGPHFLQLVRYVERNALRANLTTKAESWPWSSGWRRMYGTEQQRALLAEWPIPIPDNYADILNTPQSMDELTVLRTALKRGSPYGAAMWMDDMVVQHGLEATVRKPGRPKKRYLV
jgi:putative transposase